jgi:hypothetical protein
MIYLRNIVAGIVGIILLFSSASDLTRGYASKGWPTVLGEVVGTSTSRHRSGRGVFWRLYGYSARIQFRYIVNGVAYSGDRYRFGTPSVFGNGSVDDVRDLQELYPPGMPIRVAYKPNDPAVSVLEPGASWGSFITLSIALAGIWLAAFPIRRWLPERWKANAA